MKLLSIIVFTACTLSASEIFGQVICHDPLYITFNKTTSLSFPYSIKSVDRGSRDVLAQKALAAENVLQVKAAQQNFPETNLTVITADGQVHQFDVRYSERPSSHFYSIPKQTTTQTDQAYNVRFSDGINAAELSEVTKHILAKPARYQRSDKQYKIKFSLQGVYSHDDFMFYRIHIQNSSSINYDIDAIRIFIRDKQKVKRTATQEVEVNPVFVSDELTRVPGKSARYIVYILPKVTIPDSKLLEFDLFENDGGRDLNLRIPNRKIMKAKTAVSIK